MKNIKKKILFFASFIAILMLFGCTTGINQSDKVKRTAYEEYQVDKIPQKKINQQLSELQNVDEIEYLISAGDEFDIYVYDNPELTTKGVIVMPDGTISMELAGVVHVGEKTIEQATLSLNNQLGKYIIAPQATLIPNHIKSSTFTIVGSVYNPGVYNIKSGYRVTDAIARAQGFLHGERDGDTIDLANLDYAFIMRNKKVLPVDFKKIIKKGSRLNNIPIQNGDYIYIPSVMNLNVYVLGEVVISGACAFTDNLTLLKALNWAQGRKSSSSDIAVVVRGGLVNPTVFKVDTEEILRGRAPDFQLKPNDIVYFPAGSVHNYNLVIEKIIPLFEVLNLLGGPFGG